MSVRVNLLPEATKQRGRESRQRGVLAGVVVVVLLGLAGAWLWSERQVQDAEQQLADAQAVTAGLRGDEAELTAFAELARSLDETEELLRLGLGDEVSLGGVLQDIATVFPDDAQLDSVAIVLEAAEERPPGTVGRVSLTGQTTRSHAPGVESILLAFDRITTFDGLYLTSSNVDLEEGTAGEVATFVVDAVVTEGALTGRYRDGVPEVER